MNIRAFTFFLLAVSFSALPAAGALDCGDCNGDGIVSIGDALVAAQHAVTILTLVSPQFEHCNVFGTLGTPASPGAVVDILDALEIAKFAAGLLGSLSCTVPPVVSAGPFDLELMLVPAETVSGRRFEVTVNLLVQGTSQPAIPVDPLLVTLTNFTGTGTLRGSPRQWMRSESQVFGNLIYDPVENYLLRASAGAPHGNSVSGFIANRVAVEADVRGGVVTGAGPHPDVRFYFRNAGLSSAVATGTFDWEVVQIATGSTITSGSIPLSGQSFVDVPVASTPASGLYRVRGALTGTPAEDSYPLVRGNSVNNTRPTLASGRVGQAYDCDIMDYVNGASGAPGYSPMTFGPFSSFLALADELPPGLSLTGTLGTVSGTPTRPGSYVFTAFGVTGSGAVTRMVTHLSVFSWRDTEVASGLDFSNAGPLAVSEFDSSYSFTNWWDCTSDSTTARFYFPTNAANMRRLPAITFLHGNGFDYAQYDEIFRTVASYGYLIGSMNNPGFPQQGCTFCSTGGGGGPGYSRAVGFMDSVIDKFLQLDAGTLPGAPGSAAALIGGIDFDNLFYGGHSRGGSTTLCNLKWKPWVVRGAIPVMQVDPKAQSCLGLSNPFPPLPLLSFSAERDGDVEWPIAEASMEDKILAGMTTHVTLYGACHGYFTDSAGCFRSATVTRTAVQRAGRHWITTFLERQARGDLRLEGQLYLDEHESSTDFGVFGQRDLCGAVHIDNHQDGSVSTNLIGGSNSAVTIAITELDTHPGGWSYGRSIKHRRFGFGSGSGTNTWSAPGGSPVDTTDMTWLSFRARQYNDTSFGGVGSGNWQSWLSTWTVTLEDGAGQQAVVDLRPRFPVSGAPSPSQQRFHRFSIPLADFQAANPMFDPASLQFARFACGPAGTSSRFVAVDDIRVE